MRHLTLALLIFSVLLISCELYPQDEYEEFYVVENYLTALDELSNLYLSTTAPASTEYSFEDFAVRNASVQVNLLSEGVGSSVEDVFPYEMNEPGVYSSLVSHKALPNRTYQLTISNIPGDIEASIEAYTTVPDTFSTVSQVQDTVIYQSENQIEIDITPSENSERQSYFVFTTISQNPSIENLTPLYADFFEDEEGDIKEFAKTSSGIVNEANFEQTPNGSIRLKYPWLAVAFFEDNKIVANIIDDNIYDFLRSQSVQLGGSTLSPGEIPNALYRIEGGIGVFGSLAADTIQTYIKRPE